MGFFLTCLYVILIYLRPQEFIEEIKGWPLVAYTAYASMAVVFLQGSFRAEIFKRSPANLLLVFFWLSLPLSQMANLWLGGAIYAFNEFAKVAILYFLVVITVDSWHRIKVFIWILIFCSTFLGLQAVVQYHTGVGLVGGEALLRDQEILQARGIGIFADPNDLAIHIVPIMAFVLPAFHRRFLSPTWITGFLFLVPMVAGVVYTRSRGGMLGLAAVGWYYLRQRVGKVTSIFGLLLILSIIMALPRMGEITPEEESARSRLEHWGHGLEQFKRRPIFGIGYEMFNADYSHTAHNSFVLIFSEAGIVGATLWIALFFCTFRDLRYLREEWRGPPFLDNVVDSLVGALFAWQVSAFFLSQTYKSLSFVLMALVVAVQNVLAQDKILLDHHWGLREYTVSFVLTVAGIIFMHFLVMILWNF